MTSTVIHTRMPLSRGKGSLSHRLLCVASLIVSVQGQICMPDNNTELLAAIDNYIISGGDTNPNSDSALLYGFPIGTWCVGDVQDFSFAFQSYTEFNEALNDWNTSSATDMSFMFENAESFNQPLDNWDVRQVNTMESMFASALSFNQDLSGWLVESLRTAVSTFLEASVFDQDLCSWNEFSSLTGRYNNMFANTSCPEQDDPVPFVRPPGPYCYECFFAPTGSPTAVPTASPTKLGEPTVAPVTAAPTISLAPTPGSGKNPVAQCFRLIKRNCNCGLFFRGSECYLYVIENECNVPSDESTSKFIEKVKKRYRRWCQKPPRRRQLSNGEEEDTLSDPWDESRGEMYEGSDTVQFGAAKAVEFE